MRYALLLTACLAALASSARAHDSWVQTNTNLVRTRDAIHIELMLGNHGNEHRDFKLAGKMDLDGATLQVTMPGGRVLDLKDQLTDTGYAPQEGYWTSRFIPADAGLYIVGHVSDKVMNYGPVRSIKSAKTCFVASPTLDNVNSNNPGFDRPLGQPLELVPLTNPITPMGPGRPIEVQLLYAGKPLAETRVSFIPRGQDLTAEFDPRYERMTDAAGKASFTPTFGSYYLVAAHKEEPAQAGAGFDHTKYSATLVVYVPQICPCCSD